jgi:Domain of unknown function (DUF6431)
MLSVAGIRCKQYREQMDSGVLPELSCPDPECRGELRGHGWYKRYLGGELQALRRVRCSRCKVSHAVLPEDVCAYRDLTLDSVEAGLSAGSPSAGAEVSGQEGNPGVRRVRGWLRSAREPFAAKVQGLLGPTSGSWWRGAQEVVGQAAGWLTRLRHWLWSSWRCFLGGVSGLFRHGRPWCRPRASSP